MANGDACGATSTCTGGGENIPGINACTMYRMPEKVIRTAGFDDTYTPETHDAVTSTSEENAPVGYNKENVPVQTGLTVRRDPMIQNTSFRQPGRPHFFEGGHEATLWT